MTQSRILTNPPRVESTRTTKELRKKINRGKIPAHYLRKKNFEEESPHCAVNPLDHSESRTTSQRIKIRNIHNTLTYLANKLTS